MRGSAYSASPMAGNEGRTLPETLIVYVFDYGAAVGGAASRTCQGSALDAVAFSLDQGRTYSGRDRSLGHRLHERI
jgi:hypothetical protein